MRLFKQKLNLGIRVCLIHVHHLISKMALQQDIQDVSKPLIERGIFKLLKEDMTERNITVFRAEFQLMRDKSVTIRVSGKIPSTASFLLYTLELTEHISGGYRIKRIVDIQRNDIDKVQFVKILSKLQRYSNPCCSFSISKMLLKIASSEDTCEKILNDTIETHHKNCLSETFAESMGWRWYTLCDSYCFLFWLTGNMIVWEWTGDFVTELIKVLKEEENPYKICWLTTFITPRAVDMILGLNGKVPDRFRKFTKKNTRLCQVPDRSTIYTFLKCGSFIGDEKTCAVPHFVEKMSNGQKRIYALHIHNKLSRLRVAVNDCKQLELKTSATFNEMFKDVRLITDTTWTVIIPHSSYKKFIMNTVKKPIVLQMHDVWDGTLVTTKNVIIVGVQQMSYEHITQILKSSISTCFVTLMCVEIPIDTLVSPCYYDITNELNTRWNNVVCKVNVKQLETYDDLNNHKCNKGNKILYIPVRPYEALDKLVMWLKDIKAFDSRCVIICEDEIYMPILLNQLERLCTKRPASSNGHAKPRIAHSVADMTFDLNIKCVVYFHPTILSTFSQNYLPTILKLPSQPWVLLIGSHEKCLLSTVCNKRHINTFYKDNIVCI